MSKTIKIICTVYPLGCALVVRGRGGGDNRNQGLRL